MKVYKAVLTDSLLVLYLASIAVFLCGCGESYAKSKKQHDYVLSHKDVEFQQGADRQPTAKTLYSMAKIFIHQGRFNEAELLLQKSYKPKSKIYTRIS